MQPLIRALKKQELTELKSFTDEAIGQNYYSLKELEDIFERSLFKGTQCTLVLEIERKIKGVRITLPPNHWSQGKGKGLTESKWPHLKSETAYFQSLFIHSSLTGQGFGSKLSQKVIAILKSTPTKGIVCHSWKESPNDSSGKYLRRLGFKLVATHPLYWKEVDYVCTRCGKPCLCTAEEMYLDLVFS